MFAKLKVLFAAITAIRDIFSMAGKLWEKYQDGKREKRKKRQPERTPMGKGITRYHV